MLVNYWPSGVSPVSPVCFHLCQCQCFTYRFSFACLPVTYQRSLSKAACKALEEARSPFLVVDAPHIHLDEFRDLWATAQARSKVWESHRIVHCERDVKPVHEIYIIAVAYVSYMYGN